jgi:hypothetical protein
MTAAGNLISFQGIKFASFAREFGFERKFTKMKGNSAAAVNWPSR